MPIFALSRELVFPPVHLAEPDGLLAMGGEISRERILLAYRRGIFPWYEGEIPLWWSPDPRFVLFPEELKVSKSMKQVFRKNIFRFSVNAAFEEVIRGCMTTERRGQDGTWINEDIIRVYTELHREGYALSAEAWHGEELVGGLYGVRMGKTFFGESMFSRMSNASKFAFISLVHQLQQDGVDLIDCQVETQHLQSLGARFVSREWFVEKISRENS